MEVRIGAKTVELTKPFAEGGEARIYRLGDKTLAKIYKLPCDPELAGNDMAVAAARIRVVVAQRKLPLMPRGLPETVASPWELVRDPASGFIIGFTAPFIKARCTLADIRVNPVTDESVVAVFRSLKRSVEVMHSRGVVLGDFNDRNVLVGRDGVAYLIDVDSAQFAPFRTKVFTPEFADPNLCCRSVSTPDTMELSELHNEESDWYAWWVMLFQSLYGVHPYGGIYKPKDKEKRMAQGLRSLPEYRVSVYNPEVVYPKNARPLDDIPEVLTRFFRMVFDKGMRPMPPESLFESFRFKSDGSFDSAASVMRVVQTATMARGEIVMKRVASGEGLVAAMCHDGEPACLHLRGKTLLRNNKPVVCLKDVADLGFHLAGVQSAFSRGSQAIVLSPAWNTKVAVTFRNGSVGPLFVGSQNGMFYYDGEYKMLTGVVKPLVRVMDIAFDIEPLGFWAEGDLLMILASRGSKLEFLVHHVVWDRTLLQVPYSYVSSCDLGSVAAYAASERAWIVIRTKDSRTLIASFDLKNGVMVDSVELPTPVPSWLVELSGKCAVGSYLFSPSNEGVERIVMNSGSMDVKTFPVNVKLPRYKLVASGRSLFAIADDGFYELTVG